MPDPTEEPTADIINEVVRHYTDIWNGARVNWMLWDEYYHRTYKIWKDTQSGRPTYRPSQPTSIIDHASDTQMAFRPQIHREPIRDTQEHKEAADRLEVGLTEVMWDASLHDTELTWKQVGKHLLHYGYGIIDGPTLDDPYKIRRPRQGKKEANKDYAVRMKDFEAIRAKINPIRTHAIHPMHVLMDPEEAQPTVAVKVIKLPAYKVWELTDKKRRQRKKVDPFDLTEGGWYESVTLHEYWTLFWHAVKTVEGEDGKGGNILWADVNAWGFVPFAHKFSGFGMQPSFEAAFDPQYHAAGLLGPVAESIKLKAQRMSGEHNLLMRAAFSPVGYAGDPAEGAQLLATEQGIVSGTKDDWYVLPTPEISRSLAEVGREIDADIEEGTYRREVQGARAPGVATVGQHRMVETAASKKFTGPAAQLEHLASITAGRALMLVDKLGRTIKVRGGSLRPADMFKSYDVAATFEVSDPVLDLQRRELGLREMEVGAKSLESYLEFDARVANVSEEIKRLDQQRVRNHPLVAAQFAQAAAEEMGMGDVYRNAVEEEAAAAGADGRRTTQAERDALATAPPDAYDGNGREVSRPLRQPVSPDTAKPARE